SPAWKSARLVSPVLVHPEAFTYQVTERTLRLQFDPLRIDVQGKEPVWSLSSIVAFQATFSQEKNPPDGFEIRLRGRVAKSLGARALLHLSLNGVSFSLEFPFEQEMEEGFLRRYFSRWSVFPHDR